eukprot:6089297-Pleurochrysis_carterae.AAC.5
MRYLFHEQGAPRRTLKPMPPARSYQLFIYSVVLQTAFHSGLRGLLRRNRHGLRGIGKYQVDNRPGPRFA